ncbi:allantoinase [Apiospora phragmitis]|uniref:Allantoinase n=1 Tax=Apiospora phragmitis TaxID=2905665 RepID=A0ABR1TVU9_9PEZI
MGSIAHAVSGTAEPLTVLVSTRAVLTLPDESLVLTPASISISPESGKIVAISSFPSSATYLNYGSKLLIPGLVDAHVHLNEPGRTEWEGFNTGTRAAASGGVTTVIDMPLNAIPPTTTVAGFKEKLAASQGQCWVDVGFYGGVIPGNADELLPLVEAGVDEFPAISSNDIALAMKTLNGTPTTLMFHAEMIPPISDSVGDAVQASEPPAAPHGDLTAYQTFLESRPPVFETCAIDEIVSLAHLAPALHLHIVHLSATQAIPILKAARRAGINITAETCFHYLGLAAEEVAKGDCRYKCCPPIREQLNQNGLWDELQAGPDSVIRTIVSDHSPCTPELKLLPSHLQTDEPAGMHHVDSGVDMSADADLAKEAQLKAAQGDFFAAWGGISSVGLGLPILHSASVNRSKESLSAPDILDIVRLCCAATAQQVGMDADICVFDEAEEWVLQSHGMHWKNRCSPWEGKQFRGRVKETWLRGRKVYEHGGENLGFVSGKPVGEAIVERRTA